LTGPRQPAPATAGKAARTATTPTAAGGRIVLPFEDNRLMPGLLGPHDAHLAIIEQKLGVKARADGNIVTVTGSAEACAMAKDVLEHLYARLLKGGVTLTRGDVEGAIRHAEKAGMSAESVGVDGTTGMAQIRTRKRLISARTLRQSDYIRALERSDLVFGVGPAGTGKTYLAVVYGAAMLERGQIERIILSRPAVEAGERLGFLPGDMKDKVDPYLRPLYDALYDVLPPERVIKGLETDQIEIAPLAFMRGRTLAHSFVILDEAQNCTPTQMKMFLTRLGEGSKMVVTGDPTQVDLPRGQKSGLDDALGILKGVAGIETIGFTRADVVRRDLVGRIVEAYEGSGS
jgi:phosphate starvation-inducible protein PhoH and related proteins